MEVRGEREESGGGERTERGERRRRCYARRGEKGWRREQSGEMLIGERKGEKRVRSES